MRKAIALLLVEVSAVILGGWLETMYLDFSHWIWPVMAIITMIIGSYIILTDSGTKQSFPTLREKPFQAPTIKQISLGEIPDSMIPLIIFGMALLFAICIGILSVLSDLVNK